MNPLIVGILKRDEGLRLKPYHCTAGKLTIGYGRNLDDRGILEDEADVLLRNDIERCEEEAKEFPWYAALDPVRQAVVLSMIFNLGKIGFTNFRNTIRSIANGNYADAADRMAQSLWHTQVGARAIRLEQMMRDGK
jgi:lysozyme